MVRKIAVITGTRAEFGLLLPLIEKINSDRELELQLIVTGMHLSPEFGHTIDEIKEIGIPIADEIDVLLSSDTAYGTAKSVGLAMIGFTDSFRKLKPDIAVVLGDRFEILAAAASAMLIGIPIAHLHGGERTEGLIDEPIRHSITKMSSVHFTSTEEYKKRVMQLGEPEERVYNVGAIGLDRIKKVHFLSKEKISEMLKIPSKLPWCTVTYHPVTLDPEKTKHNVQELLAGIENFPHILFIFTKANADEHGRLVNSLIQEYVNTHENAFLFDSLGSDKYLSTVAASEMVIGNSSSGIIEVPFLQIPTIDLGIRQKGRVKGPSVIHVDEDRKEITEAIQKVIDRKDEIDYSNHPYYNGGASDRIMKALRIYRFPRVKPFVDVEW